MGIKHRAFGAAERRGDLPKVSAVRHSERSELWHPHASPSQRRATHACPEQWPDQAGIVTSDEPERRGQIRCGIVLVAGEARHSRTLSDEPGAKTPEGMARRMLPLATMNTPSFPTETDASPALDEPARVRPPGSRSALGSALGLAAFAGASFLVAAMGGRVTTRNKGWYRFLRKSPLTPPDRTFSLVWPVLYGLGALSAWRVARTEDSAARSRALALWGTQLACNAAWTPLFFGAHRPRAAMTTLVLNAATLAGYAVQTGKVDPLAAALVLPNLGWLAFAGKLNAAVIERNAGPLRFFVRE